MNKAEIRQIIREELDKAELTFSTEPVKDGEDKDLVRLVTRLSLPEELNKSTLGAGDYSDRK